MVILAIVACFAVVIALIVLAVRQANRRIAARIASVNARHGLSFSPKPELSDSRHRLVFDRENQKILMLHDKSEEIVDFAFVTSWSPEWNVRGDGRTCDHLIAISTVDVNRPRILIRTGTLAATKDWVARLTAILNHS